MHNAGKWMQEHSFRLGVAAFCVYDPQNGLLEIEQKRFEDTLTLWEWVDALAVEHNGLMVVAHNIDYDARLSAAFHHLPRLGYRPDYAIMGESCSFFKWEKGDVDIVLQDNANLWRVKLAELGRSVGVPKLEIDFSTSSKEALFVYCERDVRVLIEVWRRWLEFLDTHDLGAFSITVAGQAWNAYRHRFMPCKIGIHNHNAAIRLERQAYKGGRTQCFRVGKLDDGPYYKLDVNGLYAAMMKWYPYPRRLVKVIQNVSPDYLDYLLSQYLVIAEVAISTQQPIYPIEQGGRNAYPVGDFFTTLSTPELQIALVNGDIVGIGRVALYEPADLFGDFIDYWTPLRQRYKAEGDVARSLMCKMVRNSLQGKFGQKGHSQEVLGDAPIDQVDVIRWMDAETGATCEDWTFGGSIIRQIHQGEGEDSFPAIPAHVAAYGRVYMWSLIQAAGTHNVVYMDTDSLFVNYEGLSNLRSVIDDSELGKLKVEGVADDIEIRARKDYRFGDLQTRKGITEDATNLGGGVWEQWQFTRLRYSFREKRLAGVALAKVRKKLQFGDVVGTIAKDGTVEPPLAVVKRNDVWEAKTLHDGPFSHVWEVDEAWYNRVMTLPDPPDLAPVDDAPAPLVLV